MTQTDEADWDCYIVESALSLVFSLLNSDIQRIPDCPYRFLFAGAPFTSGIPESSFPKLELSDSSSGLDFENPSLAQESRMRLKNESAVVLGRLFVLGVCLFCDLEIRYSSKWQLYEIYVKIYTQLRFHLCFCFFLATLFAFILSFGA